MKQRSIRARLLRWLLPALLAILAVVSLLDYRRALPPIEAAYDAALANAASAIGARIQVVGARLAIDLGERSIALLRTDIVDQVYFRVVGPTGETLSGDLDLEGPRHPVGVTFYDAKFRGRTVRGVAHPVTTPAGTSVVLVAETTGKRAKARRDLVTSRILQDLAVLAFAVLVVWYAVGTVLRPLELLAGQVRSRSPQDLAPLPEEGAPREVRPLIEALNRLFGQIGATRDGQRRFVENAAHQLRTPLAGLKGQVELAAGELRALPGPPEGLARRLGRIGEATSRIVHLANQLLTLSRLERSSRDACRGRPVQLGAVVAQAVAAQIDRAIAREQDLGAETQPAALTAVEWELRELATNLIDNAVRYTPRGGRITARCGPDGEGVFVEVEDSGPGIAPDERERVFERFYRVASTPSGGSGLGLAIVHEIAAHYGASVEILDPPKGFGTTVRVRFPGPLGTGG